MGGDRTAVGVSGQWWPETVTMLKSATVSKDVKTNTVILNTGETISKSGKSIVRATTNGNQKVVIDGEIVSIGVNVFVPNPKYFPAV